MKPLVLRRRKLNKRFSFERKVILMPRIDMIATGANIAALRKKNNLSVRTLQTKMGLSSQTIFKWQRGESLPSLDNLVILADLFGVTISDIVVTTK